MPDLEARFRTVREVPPPDLWPDIESREPRPRSEPPWRWLGVVALAVAVAAGGLVVAVRAFTASDRREGLPAADPRVTATIPVGPFPRAIAAGEGGVWVVIPDNDADGGYEGTVERIDPSTNEVVASIPVDTGDAVAAGAGSVWVTGVTNTVGPGGQTSDFKGVVQRIDPATNRVVDRIPYRGGSPYDIAADATGVWVALSTGNRSGAIIHFDPTTGEEVAAIPVADVPYAVTTGEGYVWALLGPRGLVKIDPTADEVVATIDVNPVPFEMAVGEGSVWVQSWLSAFDRDVGTGSEDRLVAVRVDARTNEHDPPAVFEEGFRPVVVSEGGVWFLAGSPSGQGLTIERLDPATQEVDASAALPGIELAQRNFVAFEATTRSIWIANYRHVVTRVDLLDAGPHETVEDVAVVSETVRFPAGPAYMWGLVTGHGSVWLQTGRARTEGPDACGGNLLRFDANTGEQVDSIYLEAITRWETGGGGTAVSDDALWVLGTACPGGSGDSVLLQRVDPVANALVDALELGPGHAVDVAAGDSGVWLLLTRPADEGRSVELVQLDPATSEVLRGMRLDLSGSPNRVFTGQGAVWVVTSRTDGSGAGLVKVDPETGEVVATLDARVHGAGIGEFGLWAATECVLVRIDPVAVRVIDERPDAGCVVDPSQLDVGVGGVWYLRAHEEAPRRPRLVRYNPSTGEVDVIVDLGEGISPIDMTLTDTGIWVLGHEGSLTKVELHQ